MTSSICVSGSDAVVVGDELQRVLHEIVGARDAGNLVTDVTVPDSRGESDQTFRHITDALTTPSFLSPERIVVVRGAQHLLKHEVDVLVGWMGAPTPETTLLLGVVGKGAAGLAKAAANTISAGGGKVVDAIATRFREYGISFAADVPAFIAQHVGEKHDRVDQLARTLKDVFAGEKVTTDSVEPYLGSAGDLPPWKITDAIEAGRVDEALTVLHRTLDSPDRSALQVISTLQKYYLRLLHLYARSRGEWYSDEELKGAAEWQVKKQLTVATRLGDARLVQSLRWITEADVALKGGATYGPKNVDNDQDPTERTVMDVLLARLTRLAGAAR
jgi:DNA polymerase-3 subunit delta